MLDKNQKEEMRNTFAMTRRSFLRQGGLIASAAGLAAAMVKSPIALAAAETYANNPGASKPHYYQPGYGGASVKVLEPREGYFGTTKIVGKVERTLEAESGFSRADRGVLGQEAWNARNIPRLKSPIGDAMLKLNGLFTPENVTDGEVSPVKLKIPDPERMSQHIKDMACYLGAHEVGIGIKPEYGLYSYQKPPKPKLAKGEIYGREVKNAHKYVIVFAYDQDIRTICMSGNGYDESGFTSRTPYLMCALIAVTLAQYIRNMGYPARAHHFTNYEMAIPPMLIAAGMGEMCRTGECVLHPRLGFRHKAAAVTTDLPMAPDSPIEFGLQDFCTVCKKCAENCPAQSIPFGDQVVHNGYYKWLNDKDKCAIQRSTNPDGYGCGRCIKVCPWNSKEDTWFHQAGTWLGSKSKIGAKLLRDVDDIFGYGTEISEEARWWLSFPELYETNIPRV